MTDWDLREQEMANIEAAVLRPAPWRWWALRLTVVVVGLAGGWGIGWWLI